MPIVLWAYLFWGLVVGLPMTVVILAVGVDVGLTLGRVAALPLHADRGPSLREGTLGLRNEMATQVTPLGVPVAGWDAEVQSAVRQGKSTITTVLCHRQQVDSMVLRGPHDAWSLPISLSQPATADGAVDLALTVTRGHGGHQVIRGDDVRQAEIPPGLACPLGPLGAHETRTYVERRFPLGATATFLGCNQGGLLGPCPDDPAVTGDLVVGTASSLVGSLLLGSSVINLLLLLVVFFSFVAAFVVWKHLKAYLQIGGTPW